MEIEKNMFGVEKVVKFLRKRALFSDKATTENLDSFTAWKSSTEIEYPVSFFSASLMA